MHIYPIDYIEGAVTAADIAQTHNKRLVIAEAWLYKVKENEMGDLGQMATQAVIYGRDVFSFWESLNSKFLDILVKLVKCKNYELISLFWSTLLFGYINYDDSTKNLSYGELRQRANLEAFKNMFAGKLAATGEAYKRLIYPNRSIK